MSVRYQPIVSSFFKNNRELFSKHMLRGAFGIIHSNDLMPRNGDCHFSFRQQSDFFYLTGIDQEESVLLLHPEAEKAKDRFVLFIKETNEHIKIWEGEKLSVQQAKSLSGISNVQNLGELDSWVKRIVATTKCFYFNENKNERAVSVVQSRDERLKKRTISYLKNHKTYSMAPIFQKLRVIKSKEEIDVIQQACGITKKTFDRVLNFVKPGVWEYEIEAEISHEFTINRANGHAYNPIVAGGKNSCVLHYIDNNQLCKEEDVLLLDFGAEYGNYASDLSRTIPISGRYSKRQKQVYEACYQVFLLARNAMLPGTTLKEIQKQVVFEMEKQLVGLGLFSMNDLKRQNPEEPLYRQYFMHGTSHFMGLDVHDVGDRNLKLQEGMVLTCEPGIYIEKEGIGVRIENDILITQSGNVDLMSDIPIEAEHIEELMNR